MLPTECREFRPLAPIWSRARASRIAREVLGGTYFNYLEGEPFAKELYDLLDILHNRVWLRPGSGASAATT